MKKITLLAAALLLMNGCSSKLTAPVQLEDNPSTTINQGIIAKHHSSVPQDIYLTSQDWRARLTVHKGRYYLPNKKVIKTFYYAHHAHKILITGEHSTIKRYKDYFMRNGVTAQICLNPVHRKDARRVDMTFSHLKEDLTTVGCPCVGVKNIERATTPVIEIR